MPYSNPSQHVSSGEERRAHNPEDHWKDPHAIHTPTAKNLIERTREPFQDPDPASRFYHWPDHRPVLEPPDPQRQRK
ncbi:hypothetical protein N7451_010467 [Penicillium sp. IBT 35674x]|nr:hypothetical protein N7451_010467 [Penicillium sp. IBT 35674x]